MTRLPARFALFKGQDCLVPAQTASKIEAEATGAAEPVLHLSPDEISWPADTGIFEHFSHAPDGNAYSTFSFRGEEFAATLVREDDQRFENAVGVPVRTLALSFSSDIGRFVLSAKAHAQWASVSRFCGACGGPLVDANGHDGVEEPLDDHAHGARFCPHCKRLFFPRMSPAVIVLVRKGNAILLEHNVRFPGKRHSLIAGFVEIGETIEETAAREIREETGIEVKNLRYIKSQPWPFPDSLMLGFVAEWASGEARPDGVEIDHLDWYTADNLPELPMKGSIARSIIDAFIAGGFSNA